MKRIGNLINEQTLTVEVCKHEIFNAAKNKKDIRPLLHILTNADFYAAKIRNAILNNTFECSPYVVKDIKDNSSGKIRTLHKPKFYPDQVVAHIVVHFIGELITKRIDNYSIAGFKGKGINYGHVAIKSWLRKDRKGTKYCLKGDVKKCYEHIRPDVVMHDLKRIIKDKILLSLMHKIAFSLDSLPLGNYTSVYFANLVLSRIEQTARHDEACKHYLRNMDDFIVFGSSKRALRKLLMKIMASLRNAGMEIKGNYQIFPSRTRGVDILGYRYFDNYTMLRKRNKLKILRQGRRIVKKQNANKSIPFQQASGYLSRIGQLKHCDCFKFKKKYIKPINVKNLKGVVSSESKRRQQRYSQNISVVRPKISCGNEKRFCGNNRAN